jgi:hypothetical protein
VTEHDRRESIIEKWMLAIVADEAVGDALHIDRIDEAWRPREQWIDGGLAAFQIALSLRNTRRVPFALYVVFPLESAATRLGLDFQTRAELQQRLHRSPPSLYLFEPGEGPWDEVEDAKRERVILDDAIVQPLDPAIFGGSDLQAHCYYVEFRRIKIGEKNYCRSVFLTG